MIRFLACRYFNSIDAIGFYAGGALVWSGHFVAGASSFIGALAISIIVEVIDKRRNAQ